MRHRRIITTTIGHRLRRTTGNGGAAGVAKVQAKYGLRRSEAAERHSWCGISKAG